MTPVKTRSSNTTSSSTTSTVTPPIHPKNLTMNDVLKAVNDLKKSQSEILLSISNISKSQTSEFAQLKKDFTNLSNNLNLLQAENISLRKDLSTLKNRVESLESKPNEPNTTSTSLLPDMLLELSEREKCTFNFIVHNLPESSSATPSERIASDSKNLTDILSPLSISMPSDFKLIRLGRVQPNINRPLKVILKAKDQVINIISTFNTSKKTNPAILISISRDRTFMERKLVRQTYSELKERNEKGELGIIIKYFNGMPRIINSRPGINSSSVSKN